MKVKTATLGLGLVLVNLAGFCHCSLQEGFYRGKCAILDVEVIVAGIVTAHFIKDPTIVAALLRLQFHDCFVNGCDASILLNGKHSEKTAPANLNVRGYDIIDEAKAAVERVCPGVVSCADLIVIATRDAVFLSGGWRYNVQTGRRDGVVSQAQNVNLLPASVSVSRSIAFFSRKGFTPTDMVLLMGAHSVGIFHCSSIKNRLYNFGHTGNPDPTMDPSFARKLRSRCPPNTTVDNTANFDQTSLRPFSVDNSYYKQLKGRRGILQIDQELASDRHTKGIVNSLANSIDFPTRFAAAMVKLGATEVLTGTQGEIRRFCRNKNRPPPSGL